MARKEGMNWTTILLILTLSGCSFILCGDRPVEHYRFLGVKCEGDVLCNGRWQHYTYECKEEK